MMTETEYQIKYYIDEVKYFAISSTSLSETVRLKYNKMLAELEMNIAGLKEEVEREEMELKRDRKLLKLAKKAVPNVEEKVIVGLEHDLKVKTKKVKKLSNTLSARIDILKMQFEIEYLELKLKAETQIIAKQQVQYRLDFLKDKLENGHFD